MDRLGSVDAFVRAAELRNFSEVGRQLGISSSAVGKAISRLEERLGVRLFSAKVLGIGDIEFSQFEHRGRQFRLRQPVVLHRHFKDLHRQVLAARAFDNVAVTDIAECRRIRDAQIAFVAGNGDLHATAVELACFHVGRDHSIIRRDRGASTDPAHPIAEPRRKRTDIYGGSFENRARFLLETTRAVISVWGSDKVAVPLGPSGSWGDMSDSDPEGLFTYVATELSELKLAYLHLIEPRVRGNIEDESRNHNPVASQLIRKFYIGTIIAAGGFKGDSAEAIIAPGDADLVAFGRDFISNPDLPQPVSLD